VDEAREERATHERRSTGLAQGLAWGLGSGLSFGYCIGPRPEILSACRQAHARGSHSIPGRSLRLGPRVKGLGFRVALKGLRFKV
jgi:hypothetical protein